MREVKDLKLPPGEVLAAWPSECLCLGTGRKSPTNRTSKTAWILWIYKCHQPSQIQSQRNWISRDAKFLRWCGVDYMILCWLTYNKALNVHSLELWTMINIHSPPICHDFHVHSLLEQSPYFRKSNSSRRIQKASSSFLPTIPLLKSACTRGLNEQRSVSPIKELFLKRFNCSCNHINLGR